MRSICDCQCYVDTCDCDKCAMITDADKAKRILTNVPKGYPKAKPVVKVRSVKHHEHTTRLTDDSCMNSDIRDAAPESRVASATSQANMAWRDA